MFFETSPVLLPPRRCDSLFHFLHPTSSNNTGGPLREEKPKITRVSNFWLLLFSLLTQAYALYTFRFEKYNFSFQVVPCIIYIQVYEIA